AGALQLGMDGVWLALLLGIGLGTLLWWSAPVLIGLLGGEGAGSAPSVVATHAVTYLRWSAPGIPGMLVVLAATGALRGLQDTRTPFVVAVTGAVTNAVLCVTFVYGFGLGIAGSGLSTAIAQIGMGVTLLVVDRKSTR